MGASVSSRDSDGLTKKQNDDQIYDALQSVISENLSLLKELGKKFYNCEDIEELKRQWYENQDHFFKLIKEIKTDIDRLRYLNDSELDSSQRKLYKERQRRQFGDEFYTVMEKLHFVQKLAAIKEESAVRNKTQEIKNEFQTTRALLFIISKQVDLMKQIINELTISLENAEELLNKLDQVDLYTGLLINDASDCIKKEKESLVSTGSINPNQDPHQALKPTDYISMLQDIDGLLSTIQMLDDERQTVMTKVNEFKKLLLRRKNEK